jgi:hypothetical protein
MARRTRSGLRAAWAGLPTVLKEVTAFIGAIAALLTALAAIGVFGGGDDDGGQRASPTSTPTASANSTVPVVVTLRRSGYLTRGFVTPKGFIVATRETREPGFEATWSDAEATHREEVTLAEPPGSVVPGAVTLRVVGDGGPPGEDFPTRNAETLHEGEEVTAHLGPGRESPGKVMRVRDTQSVQDLGTVENLLVTERISNGTGGVPVLDGQRRMVAMTFGEGPETTFSIPIEDLLNQFPDAF